jgi:predicted signal transduction protein with EAL and GGDEF domain
LALIHKGEDASVLAGRSDEAMYAAKRAGRDCAYFHNGRECERIAGQTEAQAQARSPGETSAWEHGVEDLADPALDDRVELAAICDNLRAKVAELAKLAD